LKGIITKLREDRNYQLYCEELMKTKKVGFSFSELLYFLDRNFEKTKTYISPAFMKKVLQVA
jgi:hypothetical protein